MLIEAALLPRNVLNEGNQIHNFTLCYRVGIKKPTQKNPPKKNQKNPPKKPH